MGMPSFCGFLHYIEKGRNLSREGRIFSENAVGPAKRKARRITGGLWIE
jgi:hypothetical protein